MTLPPRTPPKKYTSTLIYKEKISPKVFEARFKLNEPSTINFIPGQTIMIYVAEGINRAMSIASPPSEQEVITLCHDVSPNGPGSKWMMAAKVGDPMNFMGPLGIFLMNRESPRKKVLIATGTGIAPYRSMLLQYLKEGMKDEIDLYWGLRFVEDVYWLDQLKALEKQYKNFHIVLTLSQPNDSWTGDRGRVTEHVFRKETNLNACDFYLCGNGAMVEDMRKRLEDKGVPKNQITYELFFG